jgi:hypothetical protein
MDANVRIGPLEQMHRVRGEDAKRREDDAADGQQP